MVDFLVIRLASESSERLSASSGGSALRRERESGLVRASSPVGGREKIGSEARSEPKTSACGLSRVIYSFSISKVTLTLEQGRVRWSMQEGHAGETHGMLVDVIHTVKDVGSVEEAQIREIVEVSQLV